VITSSWRMFQTIPCTQRPFHTSNGIVPAHNIFSWFSNSCRTSAD